MTTKNCPCCNEVKSLDAFYLRPNGKPQSHCKACGVVRSKKWQAENKDKNRTAVKKYDEANRAKRAAAAKANRDANKVAVDKWRGANREAARAATRAWTQANPEKTRALESKRRAVKLNALPPWADLGAIADIYSQAALLRRIGIDVHVDHEIPLQGKEVCGLHVQNNLRIILASENLSKGNRLLPVEL